MRSSARFFATIVLAAALGSAGCEQGKSANPLSPDVAGPLPGVQITAPQPLEPGTGAQLVGQSSDLTLVLANASSSGQRPLMMKVEIAADAGFSQVVHQADRVTPGSDGRTAYRLPEPLGAGYTYYWRARAFDGANEGPFSSVAHFSVIEGVVIGAPTPLEPIGQIATNRPEFKVRNGRISGTDGVVYRFEVGTAPDPSSITAVVSVAPGSNGTTSMSLGELPYGQTLFWRAYATDGTTTSDFSAAVSFTTASATAPPVPTLPPAAGGPVGGARTISLEEAVAIIRNVHDSERWDLGSRSSRDDRVAFLFRATAAIHYGHPRYNPKGPDANWCVKDAGSGRPPSDDVIVRCDSREAWDLIGGAGGDGYSFHADYLGRLPSNQNVYPPPRSALP
ncbi:MAG: hypothetical protein ABR606_10825 [Vicinamibacterales bacterium]